MRSIAEEAFLDTQTNLLTEKDLHIELAPIKSDLLIVK